MHFYSLGFSFGRQEVWLLAYFQRQLAYQVSGGKLYQVLDEDRDLNF